MADASPVSPRYTAAKESMAVAHRTHRQFLAVTGKAPRDMLLGILTSGLPGLPQEEGGGLERGRVVYSAVLDPRGKIISDLRVFSDGSGGFVLDLPDVGLEGVIAHFRKFLPPRLAKVTNFSGNLGMLTIAGPAAVHVLATEVLAGYVSLESLELLNEGEELISAPSPVGSVRIVRNGDLNTEALDLLLATSSLERVRDIFLDAGAVALDSTALDVLRMEKGRPSFGVDMDESIIPVEAGIHRRAIDYGKGCYTGQEVIIRIRDRGHVNKRLCGLLLGDLPPPQRGEELFLSEKEKSVGWITSSCISPAFGQAIAFGYLRRPGTSGEPVRLGAVDGPMVAVRSLGDEGWECDGSTAAAGNTSSIA